MTNGDSTGWSKEPPKTEGFYWAVPDRSDPRTRFMNPAVEAVHFEDGLVIRAGRDECHPAELFIFGARLVPPPPPNQEKG